MKLRSHIAATVLALGLVVGQVSSCSTIDPKTVITDAIGLCKFAPDLNTVNTLIHANGALQTATAIAQAICSVVSPPAATEKRGATAGDQQWGTIVTPNGPVPVVGHFVQ